LEKIQIKQNRVLYWILQLSLTYFSVYISQGLVCDPHLKMLQKL